MTSRRLVLLAACVFAAVAQVAKQPPAKPQFDIKVPPFQGTQPVFFAIAGQQGRPGLDAWTITLPASNLLAAAEQFYLDELKGQGFSLTSTSRNKGGVHHKLLNKERAIQANVSAGGKSDKPKIAIAFSWMQ